MDVRTQSRPRRIAFVAPVAAATAAPINEELGDGLREYGFADGVTVQIDSERAFTRGRRLTVREIFKAQGKTPPLAALIV
jgi:hypothetical protein